jgi:hypothetical protein
MTKLGHLQASSCRRCHLDGEGHRQWQTVENDVNWTRIDRDEENIQENLCQVHGDLLESINKLH